MEITVLIGVIGSGKDFTANLWTKEQNANIIGFSDGVREYTFDFLGWKPKDAKAYETWKDSHYKMTFGTGFIEGDSRDFLTRVGTKMRELDPDFWADYTINDIDYAYDMGEEHVIIPDCRYENEAQAIADFAYAHDDVILNFILCNYKSERYKIHDHHSEHFAQQVLEYETQHLTNINNVVKEILHEYKELFG